MILTKLLYSVPQYQGHVGCTGVLQGITQSCPVFVHERAICKVGEDTNQNNVYDVSKIMTLAVGL